MAKKDERKAVIMNPSALCDKKLDQVFERLAKQALSDPSFKELSKTKEDERQ